MPDGQQPLFAAATDVTLYVYIYVFRVVSTDADAAAVAGQSSIFIGHLLSFCEKPTILGPWLTIRLYKSYKELIKRY